MKNKENILENFTWSFSSINTYNNCPLCFYLTYLCNPKLERVQNAFAQWGTLCHSLFERYAKGDLELFELGQVYQSEYNDEVKLKFPYNKYVDLGEKYYKTGFEYFNKFDGFNDNWDIICVEQKVDISIQDNKFVGYIDLVVEEKTSKDIIIIDHKSKSAFKNETELKEYARQLYLYSIFIKQIYGKYPSKLMFNMFRADELVEIDFDLNELQETVNWLLDIIQKIKSDMKFIDKIASSYKSNCKSLKNFKKSDFQCNELCSVRPYCIRSKDYKK